MSENKHQMKLRHKAELTALRAAAQANKANKGANKKLKDDEKTMLAQHKQQLAALEQAPVAAAAAPTQEDDAKQQHSDEDDAKQESHSDQSTSAIAQQLAATHLNADASIDTTSAVLNGTTRLMPTAARHASSRAAQKRAKREQEDEQRRREFSQQLAAQPDDARTVERDAIARKLAAAGLQLQHIRSDGHCLFRSVAVQLERCHCKPISHIALRRQAVDFIRQRRDEFAPFLTDAKGDSVPATDAAFEQYCTRMQQCSDQDDSKSQSDETSDHATSHDVEWGGHSEIVAISGVLQREIQVYSAQGDMMRVLHESVPQSDASRTDQSDSDALQPISICFHEHLLGLGHHYNACVPLQHDAQEQDES